MKPDRLPAWSDLLPVLDLINDESTPVEVYVLKTHLFVEATMYRLLALRLQINTDDLPPLQFFPLAKLALAGATRKPALAKILALNNLRNEHSHELDNLRLQPAYQKFVRRCELSWPDETVGDTPDELEQLRELSIRAAASGCVSEVLCAVVEDVLRTEDLPPETAASGRELLQRVRSSLAKSRGKHSKDQKDARTT
jgi:hypothetical protein